MIFEVRDVAFSYPGFSRRVLDGVSLPVEDGAILSVLGPNGAGKSTLLNCMMALLQPSAGEILLEGRPVSRWKTAELARVVSYVPQNINPVFGYTVLDYVTMGRAPLISGLGRPGKADRAAAQEALERLGLTALADRPCTEISGGERQMAAIARAIVRSPQVILFDEPTAHLDVGNQLRTLKVIKGLSGQGYTIVITTHNPDHAILLGGNAALLTREGAMTCGTVEALLTEDALSAVYGAELKLRFVEELDRTVCLFPNL